MLKCIFVFSFDFKVSHDAIVEAMLVKSMFRTNKSLLIQQQISDVTWQNIPWQGVEYFAMSYIFSTWQTNILRIFHGVAWNIFKNSFLLTSVCSFAYVNLFTHSPASVVAFNLNRKGHVRRQNMPYMFIHIDVKDDCGLKWAKNEKLKKGWN